MRSAACWWAAWVLVCIPAGALAGVGLIEFNWAGSPYGGGFAGYLVLFGGFLALGQTPVVFAFARHVLARTGVSPERRGLVPLLVTAVAWTVAGLLGWTFGSGLSVLEPVEMASATDVSSNYFFSRALPWSGMALLQVLVLAAALSPAFGPNTVRQARIFRLFAACAAFVVASVVGGLLVEDAAQRIALSVGVGGRTVVETLIESLQGSGVAENVAGVVIPYALVVPALYGSLTGLALLAIRGLATPSGGSGGAPGGSPGR